MTTIIGFIIAFVLTGFIALCGLPAMMATGIGFLVWILFTWGSNTGKTDYTDYKTPPVRPMEKTYIAPIRVPTVDEINIQTPNNNVPPMSAPMNNKFAPKDDEVPLF